MSKQLQMTYQQLKVTAVDQSPAGICTAVAASSLYVIHSKAWMVVAVVCGLICSRTAAGGVACALAVWRLILLCCVDCSFD
jgi:hypothetical protein